MSALLVVRDGRVLMVRARGRDVLYLPGGKVEPGETAVQAAVREAHEETGVRIAEPDVDEFAVVTEPAHGQAPGTVVTMTLFLLRDPTDVDPVASAEVDEVEWVTAGDAGRCPPAGVETLRLLVAAGLLDAAQQ